MLAVFPIDGAKAHQLKQDSVDERGRLQAAIGAAVLEHTPAHALQFGIHGFRKGVLSRGIALGKAL
jgi:hypothetical protein